jgi:hypothetical protein
LQIKTKTVISHTADSKPVKQEVKGTETPLQYSLNRTIDVLEGTTQIIVKKLKTINRGCKISAGQAVANFNHWPHKKRKPIYNCVLRCSLQHPLSQVWQVTRITIKTYTSFMTPTTHHYSN